MADLDLDVLPTAGEGKPIINDGFVKVNGNFAKLKAALLASIARVTRLEAAAGFPNGAYVPDMGADPHRRLALVNPAAYALDTPVGSGAGYSTSASNQNPTYSLPLAVLATTDTVERLLCGGASVLNSSTGVGSRFTVWDRNLATGAWTPRASVDHSLTNSVQQPTFVAVTSPDTAIIEVTNTPGTVVQLQLSFDDGSSTLSIAASTPAGVALGATGASALGNITAVNKVGRMTPGGLVVCPRPFDLGLRLPSLGAPAFAPFDTGLHAAPIQQAFSSQRLTHDFLASDALLVAAPARNPRTGAWRVVPALLDQDADGAFNVTHHLPLPDGQSDVSQVWALTPSAALVQVFNAGARSTYLLGVEEDEGGNRMLALRGGAVTGGVAAQSWPFAFRAREGDRNALVVATPGAFAGGTLPVTLTPLILAADGTLSTGTARTVQLGAGLGLANGLLLDVRVLPSGRVAFLFASTTGQQYLQSAAAS